jgi:hypothetical protein
MESLELERKQAWTVALGLVAHDAGKGNTEPGEKVVGTLGIQLTQIEANLSQHLMRQGMQLGGCDAGAQHLEALARIVAQGCLDI